jgi:hypothetical protein
MGILNFLGLKRKEPKGPTCAKCQKSFEWGESYVTQETPGSAPYNAPGTGDTRPRVFCPHCGALVVDWHITRKQDYDEWAWYGNNGTVNRKVALPPDPYSPGFGKGVLYNLIPRFSDPELDITRIKAWEKEEEMEKAGEEIPGKPQEEAQDQTAKGDVKALINDLREDNMGEEHKAALKELVGIGAPAVEPLIAAFRTAGRPEDYHADKDKHLRSGIVKALGEIGDPRAVESLLLALDDNIPFVRIDTARSLQKIGDEAIASEAKKLKNPRDVIKALEMTVDWDKNQEVLEEANKALKVITGS